GLDLISERVELILERGDIHLELPRLAMALLVLLVGVVVVVVLVAVMPVVVPGPCHVTLLVPAASAASSSDTDICERQMQEGGARLSGTGHVSTRCSGTRR